MVESDSRPPLCVYCVSASFFHAAWIGAINYSADPIVVTGVLGMADGFTIKPKATTELNLMPGNPTLFVAFLRALGPRDYLRFVVNSNTVNPWAEFDYFGAKVCAVHIHDAMEAWNNRHARSNRIAGY